MSKIIDGWRCEGCGGKVRKTAAKKHARHFFIFCNYDPCINSPAKGGGDMMIDYNFDRGFTPNWVTKEGAK